MITDLLTTEEYHPYYEGYINKATSIGIKEGLQTNLKEIMDFLSKLPKEKEDYAYAKGKWTVKDILLHIIDAERVFAYRALRIGRGDETPLAGFEQDDYVEQGKAANRSFESLIEEYESVRKATISLFKSFDDKTLLLMGKASGSSVSVRALGYIITGHENHHMQVIKERYL
ncbi:DinB family protein [Winogradskyella sp.]|uniref:DinB family protein n=1 Tax=Winogradskyella sp. TaxID=1883156 RepID=UPI0035115F6E